MGSVSTQGERPRGWPLARTRWAIIGVAAGVVGSSWFGVARHPSVLAVNPPAASADEAAEPVAGPAEVAQADGMIDGAVRKVAQKIEDASTTVRDRYDKVREESRKGALAAEVNSRLRQDRSLNSDRIDVQVEEEGTVILKGQVPDDASKELAVDSTRDIRGVLRVEDHLAVPPKPRVFSAPSGVATAPRARRLR
jgi:hypothetical protein